MHYSLRKAAGLLGLGRKTILRTVAVDHRGCASVTDCRRVLRECAENGDTVTTLVGVAGTTDYGSIDPLDQLADLAAEFDVPFHVDAAWVARSCSRQSSAGGLPESSGPTR